MRHHAQIPNRLRRYRKIMGYSQRDVARLLGMKSPSRISKWESGKRIPSIRNLIKLSILYHTLIENLYYDLREAILAEYQERNKKVAKSNENIRNRPP
jgi:transcriptional regulator with XRE-family HTH domain